MERPHGHGGHWLPTVLLAAVLAAVGLLIGGISSLRSDVSKALERKDLRVQQLQSTWKSSGVEHEITTVRQPGESLDDFTTRHNQLVEAQKAIYPPDA